MYLLYAHVRHLRGYSCHTVIHMKLFAYISYLHNLRMRCLYASMLILHVFLLVSSGSSQPLQFFARYLYYFIYSRPRSFHGEATTHATGLLEREQLESHWTRCGGDGSDWPSNVLNRCYCTMFFLNIFSSAFSS